MLAILSKRRRLVAANSGLPARRNGFENIGDPYDAQEMMLLTTAIWGLAGIERRPVPL